MTSLPRRLRKNETPSADWLNRLLESVAVMGSTQGLRASSVGASFSAAVDHSQVRRRNRRRRPPDRILLARITGHSTAQIGSEFWGAHGWEEVEWDPNEGDNGEYVHREGGLKGEETDLETAAWETGGRPGIRKGEIVVLHLFHDERNVFVTGGGSVLPVEKGKGGDLVPFVDLDGEDEVEEGLWFQRDHVHNGGRMNRHSDDFEPEGEHSKAYVGAVHFRVITRIEKIPKNGTNGGSGAENPNAFDLDIYSRGILVDPHGQIEWVDVEEVEQLTLPPPTDSDTNSDSIPTDGVPPTDSGGFPTDGFPTDGAPTDGFPTDGAPTDGAPTDGAPTDGAPTTDSDGFPTDGFPTDGFPTDGFPTDGGGFPTDSDSCVPEDTLILMGDGSLKYAKDVQVGDCVTNLLWPGHETDENNHHNWTYPTSKVTDRTFTIARTSRVTRVIRGKHDGLYKINKKVRATFEHPLLIQRDNLWGWVSMDKVRIGDVISLVDGDGMLVHETVWHIEYIAGEHKTVNFCVPTGRTFIADGVVVHNTTLQLPSDSDSEPPTLTGNHTLTVGQPKISSDSIETLTQTGPGQPTMPSVPSVPPTLDV